MSLQLKYYLRLDTVERDRTSFVTAFYTRQISSSTNAAAQPPAESEMEAGSLFTSIRSHKKLSVVVPAGYPSAVHALLGVPKNQPNLRLNIQFLRQLERRELVNNAVVKNGQFDYENLGKSHYEQSRCRQLIANLSLLKVKLLNFRATEGDSYTADLEVTGGTETEVEPAAECDKWVIE